MNIPLDSAIRDWVLLPIIIFVVLVTYARLYGMRLLSPPPEGHTPIDMKGVHQRSLLAQSQRLRMYGGYISQRGWAMRKTSLVGTPTKGLLDDKAVDANPMASMAGAGSMDMMKMQFLQMGSQFGVGMLIGSFFSGFVTLRLPFSLTERFKAITQQGVGVPGLDSAFVSTMSWFYICQFGLQTACFRLLSRGGSSAEEAQLAQMQMGMGMAAAAPGAPGQAFMAKTLFANEVEAHKLTEWTPTPLLLGERSLLQEASRRGLCPVPVTSMAWDMGAGGGAAGSLKKTQ